MSIQVDGKTVVLSFKDDLLKSRIEELGGLVKTAVSGKTNLLITKNEKQSNKMVQDAKARGVKVVTRDEFENSKALGSSKAHSSSKHQARLFHISSCGKNKANSVYEAYSEYPAHGDIIVCNWSRERLHFVYEKDSKLATKMFDSVASAGYLESMVPLSMTNGTNDIPKHYTTTLKTIYDELEGTKIAIEINKKSVKLLSEISFDKTTRFAIVYDGRLKLLIINETDEMFFDYDTLTKKAVVDAINNVTIKIGMMAEAFIEDLQKNTRDYVNFPRLTHAGLKNLLPNSQWKLYPIHPGNSGSAAAAAAAGPRDAYYSYNFVGPNTDATLLVNRFKKMVVGI